MADLQKTIEIIFGGDDRVSQVVTGISKKITSLSTVAENVASPFAILADGVLKADAALSALAVGGLALAFNKSMEFESALVDLKKVLGEGELASLDKARSAAINLSETYGQSSSEILQSTANFKQAGFDVEESMTLTKVAMDLVIAGGVDAAQASDLVVASLKGFKATAEDAARLVDILNEVSNRYATDVEQLAIGMAGLSPIANQMGFSMEETAGILTPVIEVFRSGDEAAIALKTGLLKLIDDTKPVKEALASIGVSQADANGALRSGKDILMDVAKAFTGLEDSQKLFVTQQLVGIDQSARMVEVFDQLSKTSEITAVAMGASGSAAKEVAQRLATAEVQINIFKASMGNLAVVVGDQFRAAATEAIAGGSQIVQALRESIDDGSFDEVLDALNRFASRLGDFLSGVAKALPEALDNVDFSNLIDAFGRLGDQVVEFFEGIDLTTADGLAVAIQGVVDTIAALVNTTAGMVDAFQPYFDALKEAVTRAKDMDAETANSFGNLLLTAKMVVDAGAGVALAFAAMKASGAEMGAVFDVVFGSLKAGWNALDVAFDTMILGITSALINFFELVEGLNKFLGLTGLVGSLDGAIESMNRFRDGIKEDRAADWQESVAGVAQAFDGLTGKTDKAAEAAEKYGAAAAAGSNVAKGSVGDVGKKTDELAEKTLNLPKAWEALDSSIRRADDSAKKMTVSSGTEIGKAREALEAAGFVLDGMTGEQIIELKALIDLGTAHQAVEKVKTDAKTPIQYTVKMNPDGSFEGVNNQLEKIPEEKEVKVKPTIQEIDFKVFSAQLDAVEVLAKGYFSTIQESIKWEAKLEIAEVEANSKKVAAILESVGSSATAAGGVIESLFGNISELHDVFASYTLERWVEDQIKIQQESLAVQREMTDAEIALMEARTKAYERGDAQIQIDGAGLQPHLESFMFEILSAIQIRASQEGASFLVGL